MAYVTSFVEAGWDFTDGTWVSKCTRGASTKFEARVAAMPAPAIGFVLMVVRDGNLVRRSEHGSMRRAQEAADRAVEQAQRLRPEGPKRWGKEDA